MELFSLIIFILIFWSWGKSIFLLIKEKNLNFFENNIMSLGIGLSLFPVLSFLLNKLALPVDWRLYLFLGLIIPISTLILKIIKKKKIFDLKNIKESPWFILVIIGFIFVIYVMITGAFVIPYLEDGDPYSYAVAAKYIKYTKSYSKGNLYVSHYLDPYPPAYSGLMGLLHQTNDNLVWTLKFFNALIVGLSILFSYYFFKILTKSSKISSIASFGLAMIPCFSSHFIFSQALSVTSFFPVFYTLFKSSNIKWWAFPASIGIGGFLLTQTSTATAIAGFIGILISLSLLTKGLSKETRMYFISSLGGLIIGLLLFWLPNLLFNYEYSEIQMQMSMSNSSHRNIMKSSDFFADYKFSDFFYSPISNKIDNPKGLGPAIFILTSLGFIFFISLINKKLQNKKDKKFFSLSFFIIFTSIIFHSIKSHKLFVEKGSKAYVSVGITLWFVLLILGFLVLSYIIYKNKEELSEYNHFNYLLLIFWFIWGIIGVLGDYFPFGWLPNRFWALLAIPASLILAYSTSIVSNTLSSIFKKNQATLKILIILLLLILVAFTAGTAKKKINTSFWPQHEISNIDELKGYLAVKDNMPKETKIFDACRINTLVSYNMFFPTWNEEILNYIYTPEKTDIYAWDYIYIFRNKNRTLANSPIFSNQIDNTYQWLKRRNFKYLIINAGCNEFYPNQKEELDNKLNLFNQNQKFNLILNSNNQFYLFEIR